MRERDARASLGPVRFPWTPLACLLFPLWFLKRGLLGLRRARERDG